MDTKDMIAWLGKDPGLGRFAAYLSADPRMLEETPGLREFVASYIKKANEAGTDHLTGMYNRRSFFRRANGLLRDTRQYHGSPPLSLTLYDLNNFKQINDTYGHEAGDRALKEVAAAFGKHYQRGSEVAARIGGDEFAVAQHCTFNNAQRTAQEVRDELLSVVITDLPVDISFGTSQWADGMDIDNMLVSAEPALKTHKKYVKPSNYR